MSDGTSEADVTSACSCWMDKRAKVDKLLDYHHFLAVNSVKWWMRLTAVLTVMCSLVCSSLTVECRWSLPGSCCESLLWAVREQWFTWACAETSNAVCYWENPCPGELLVLSVVRACIHLLPTCKYRSLLSGKCKARMHFVGYQVCCTSLCVSFFVSQRRWHRSAWKFARW